MGYEILNDIAAGKKVFIYGTGKIAEQVIKALCPAQITGILDRSRVMGQFCGYPIKMWQEIEPGDGDLLIIASSKIYYKEIYDRIKEYADLFAMEVYGASGVNLRELYDGYVCDNEAYLYYAKNRKELEALINQHDAISFDLFDTLLMRTVLEPIDIFDIVEERLAECGIEVKEFKKYRRTAELQSGGGNINRIYEVLGDMLHWDHNLQNKVISIEFECEEQHIVARKSMVDILNYACSNGKTINIISDMYWPEQMLQKLVEKNGIHGYDRIFVSCDYNAWKGNGLFEEYLLTVPGKKCLHIGDDLHADVIAAQKSGITAYGIKSALAMLRISNLKKCQMFSLGSNERRYLGEMVAEVLNDPFCLHNTYGCVNVSTIRGFIDIFLMPLLINFLSCLGDVLKNNQYDAILFGSRDGYFFHKLYEQSSIYEKYGVKGYYFPISRSLAIKLSTFDTEHFEFWKDYCGAGKQPEIIYNIYEPYVSEDLECQLNGLDGLRKQYIEKIENMGISIEGKYLFFDLCSSGTCQVALNQLFLQQLDGIYIYKIPTNNYSLEGVYSLLHPQKGVLEGMHYWMEKIFTAPYGQLKGIDQQGEWIYAMDDRTSEELEFIDKVHDMMIQDIHEKFSWLLMAENALDERFVRTLLVSFNHADLSGEMEIMKKISLDDGMTGEKWGIRGQQME